MVNGLKFKKFGKHYFVYILVLKSYFIHRCLNATNMLGLWICGTQQVFFPRLIYLVCSINVLSVFFHSNRLGCFIDKATKLFVAIKWTISYFFILKSLNGSCLFWEKQNKWKNVENKKLLILLSINFWKLLLKLLKRIIVFLTYDA